MTVSKSNRSKRSRTVTNDELLTTSEVAELAKVSEQTVRRWRFDGDLPFIRLGYRTVRHRRSDVEDLIYGVTRD